MSTLDCEDCKFNALLNSVEATLKLQALLLSHAFEVVVALTQYPTVAHALARADVHGCTHEVVNDHLAQSHQESQKLLSSQKLFCWQQAGLTCFLMPCKISD